MAPESPGAARAAAGPRARHDGLLTLPEWRERLVRWWPRFGDRRFWYVQLLVLMIAGVHDAIEAGGYLPRFGLLYFVPISLFFLPVVYAALNFGFPGSVATAAWATLITIPNWIFWHSGLERWGVIFQMGIINAVAAFVGHRVDLENRAREQAEMTGAALKASESRYRRLFETAAEAVLVVDLAGVVHAANATAGRLFGADPRALVGRPLDQLLGPGSARQVLQSAEAAPPADLVLPQRAGTRVVRLEPLATPFTDLEGHSLVQVILRDVTEQRWQEEGLRSYAARILHAQEEERKRIAQELHDETIQSLVLVCRKLDELESLATGRAPELRENIRQARELTVGVTDSLRHFTRGLRPTILDDLGLVPAVRWLVADVAQRTGLKTRFEAAGEPQRLHPEAALGLFRIAQEAIRNVERHAEASSMVVGLEFRPEQVSLTVRDDGRGFTPSGRGGQDFAARGRLGLMGMEERARLLGGTLSLASTPGAGTTVHVAVPLTEPEGKEGGQAQAAPVAS